MTSHDDRFSSLPKELLCQILHPLIRRDLKSLRLQNRRLNAVVGETLFRTITVQETQASLRQLQNVAISPSWSHQVETVCWLFPFWNDEEVSEIRGELDLKQYYLDLKRLTNVKSIEILNGCGQLYEYEAFAGDGGVYSLLRPTNLLPRLIVGEGFEMSIAYSADGSVTSVNLKRSARKPSVLIDNIKEDVWDAADLDMHNPGPGDDTHDFSTCASTSPISTDLMVWQLFSSFIFMHHLTLKVVNFYSLIIPTTDLAELASSPCLTCLTFTDVEIMKDVTVLLEAIKGRKVSTSLPPLTVTLEQTRQDNCNGEISVSDADIMDWVEGRRNDFLDKIRQAFEPKGSEDGSGWEWMGGRGGRWR